MWNFFKALPLGLGVPMIAVAASIGPDEVARNLAKWPASLGWDDTALWVAEHLTGPKVFWGVVIFCVLYVFIVWGLPTLLRRLKTDTAAVAIPIIVAVLLFGAVPYGYFLSQPTIWKFTSSEKKLLLAAVAKESKKYDFTIIPVPASPSAVAYSYAVFTFMGWEQHWGVNVAPFDPYYSPKDNGLRISIKQGSDPDKNETAQALKRIFGTLDPKIIFVGDPRIPEGHAVLLVGGHP